ncbi:MAG: hypothetical protein E7632_01395 [Ruminococcaceae bacterium]|nr:hypothetical protein [Oscillospiraceae bacterium]
MEIFGFQILPPPPSVMPVYNFENLVLMFFIFMVVGWIWEVIYTAATERVIAKRGMLHGPWLPIYGVGGILVVLILNPFYRMPALVFVLAVTLCSTVEYSTALAIERFFGCRWWDYSEKFGNIRGRICLGGMLLFGLSGTIAVCSVAPVLNDSIDRIPRGPHRAIIIILSAIFIVDVVVSFLFPNRGKGVTYDIQKNSDKSDHSDDT